jgi:hypothetical protein
MHPNEALVEYMRGKTVALVGPASSALGTGKGEFIDSHDVVVRINKHFFANPDWAEDVGTRTDVLYSCLIPSQSAGGAKLKDAEFLKKQAYDFVVFAAYGVKMLDDSWKPNFYDFPNLKRFLALTEGKFPLAYIDRARWKHAFQGCKGKPTTGTNTVWHLASLPVKSLYITGISFYKTGYVPGYRHGLESQKRAHAHIRKSSHAGGGEREFRYICSIIRDDPRIQLDPFLEGVVDRYESQRKQAKK